MSFATFVLILTIINVASGCEVPQNGQSSSIPTTTTVISTTTTATKNCKSCPDFSTLIKPVNVPNSVAIDSFTTTEVNGCLQTIFIRRNDDGARCDYQVFITNSATESTISITNKTDYSIKETVTCNANGMYEINGMSFDGVYCTESNCN